MAISVGNHLKTPNYGKTVSGSHSLSWGSGNNRLVIALLMNDTCSPQPTHSVTYNGVSMTQIAMPNGNGTGVSMHYILDTNLPASSGSYTVTGTISGSVDDDLQLYVLEMSGVNQSAPYDYGTDSGLEYTSNCSLDTNVNKAIVVGGVGNASGSGYWISHTSNYTEVDAYESGAGTLSSCLCYRIEPTAGAKTTADQNNQSWYQMAIYASWDPAQNDFAGDGNCYALWRFENGALTTDSKGGNTLSSHGSPTADTTDYQEGSGCVDLELTTPDYYDITDASLGSGFPLKSGDTNKKISVCAWYKGESSGAIEYIFSKYASVSGGRSFGCIKQTSNKFGILVGYNSGNSFEEHYTTNTISTGIWYHIGFTFDDSDGSYKIRVWDDNAGSLLEEASGNFTNNIYINSQPVGIGCRVGGGYVDGRLDEVVVFNDILTSGEIDEIRDGAYSLGGVSRTPSAGSLGISGGSSVMGLGIGVPSTVWEG